jgi:hypothetical protein
MEKMKIVLCFSIVDFHFSIPKRLYFPIFAADLQHANIFKKSFHRFFSERSGG